MLLRIENTYLASVLLVLAFLAVSLPSVRAADISGSATAKVIAPIALTEQVLLDFGLIATNGLAGTATIILATHIVTTTGGVEAVANSNASRATVGVLGEPFAAVTITIPASFTLSDGSGHSMTVDTIATGGTSLPRVLAEGGNTQGDWVGTLNVGAGQAVGSYTGTYPVTAFYD